MECEGSLVAYELDEIAAHKLRQSVIVKVVGSGASKKEAARLATCWVRAADFLTDADSQDCSDSLFGNHQGSSASGDADFVIGNPPYIRLEDIPPSKNLVYRPLFRTMQGRADIYVAFFEAALNRLVSGGVCAFICADRWMRNQYGSELRRLITARYSVEAVIEMHEVPAFQKEVIAYPAVTVIRRARQGQTVVARANSHAETLNPSSSAALLREFRESTNGASLPIGIEGCRTEEWFSGTEPWPCTSPERLALVKRLEHKFPPLESKVTRTRVGIGVATGLDKVYITRDRALVEEDRLLPLAMTADTTTGVFTWSGNYLVNPWSAEGLVDLKGYPRLKDYFEKHRKEIEGRHVAKRDVRNWYRTIDRVSLDLVRRPKLYVPDIKNTIHPVLDKGEAYPHHNLYVVISEGWDLRVLGALLMSDVGRFFVECYGVRMRGGYLRMQAQYLRRIRVPEPDRISAMQAKLLTKAFDERDTSLATRISLELYGIDGIPPEE